MSAATRLADRGRTISVAVGLIILLLLGSGFAIIFSYETAYREQRRQEARVQAEILAAGVTAALDFDDRATAQELVEALRVNPQVLAAAVFDDSGQLFAGYQRTPGTLPTRPPATGAIGLNIEEVTPVIQGGKRIGTAYLLGPREPVSRRIVRYLMLGLLVLMAAVAIGVLGIGSAALRRANRALEQRAADLSEAYRQLKVEGEERANAEEQLRQAQKMQALGQLTGGIAHDFNNMLTVIQGSADLLRRPNLVEEKRIRFAEAIVQTATRAAALTAQLLAFARRQPLRPEIFDINARIEAMTDLLDRTLGETIAVETELTPGLCLIETDPAQMESALLNIAVNSRDAMPEGGVLTIRTSEAVTPQTGARAVAIAISDTGSGIEPETLGRVFEPFFTTKSVGKGTGLGLSQVYGFATQSGGDVLLSSEPGGGTTVTIILPCSDGAETPNEESAEAGGGHRVGRILVVDDNEEVGAFAEALLAELGHEVVRASSGPEALDAFDADVFDVVFTDVVMPGMSGLELADAIRTRRPGIAIVLTTGYSDQVSSAGSGGLPILYKPYRLESLATMLDRHLAPAEG